MGLDQRAYSIKNEKGDIYSESDIFSGYVNTDKCKFVWRKHARLQTFMEKLCFLKTRFSADEFNCYSIKLTMEEIEDLEEKVKTEQLPFCPGGFFY